MLLDISSDGDDRLGALEQLRSAAPDVPIIVLAHAPDPELGVLAVRAGAQDFLSRTELNPTLLVRAVRYAIERKRSEAELARQALHDPLTELPNRALFIDRLTVAIDRSRRKGTIVAVLFLDVDGFKRVNDSMGHASGDLLLTALAGRFVEMLRPMDTVARFGGDEFTFLFEELESRARGGSDRRPNQPVCEPAAAARGRRDRNRGQHRDRARDRPGGHPRERDPRGRRGDVPRQGAQRRPRRALRRGLSNPGEPPPELDEALVRWASTPSGD